MFALAAAVQELVTALSDEFAIDPRRRSGHSVPGADAIEAGIRTIEKFLQSHIVSSDMSAVFTSTGHLRLYLEAIANDNEAWARLLRDRSRYYAEGLSCSEVSALGLRPDELQLMDAPSVPWRGSSADFIYLNVRNDVLRLYREVVLAAYRPDPHWTKAQIVLNGLLRYETEPAERARHGPAPSASDAAPQTEREAARVMTEETFLEQWDRADKPWGMPAPLIKRRLLHELRTSEVLRACSVGTLQGEPWGVAITSRRLVLVKTGQLFGTSIRTHNLEDIGSIGIEANFLDVGALTIALRTSETVKITELAIASVIRRHMLDGSSFRD